MTLQDTVTLNQILAAVFFFMTMATLLYVYLLGDKYVENSQSRAILRIIGSLSCAIGGGLFLDGSLEVTFESEAAGPAISATGGMGIFALVWMTWDFYDKKQIKAEVSKLIEKNTGETALQNILGKLGNDSAGGLFATHLHAAELRKGVSRIVQRAKDGDKRASEALIKLDRDPGTKVLTKVLETYFAKCEGDYDIRALLAFLKSDFDTALALADTALRAAPEDHDLLFLKAMALEHKGDDDAAATVLRKALRATGKPDTPEKRKARADTLRYLAHLSASHESAQLLLREAYELYRQIGDTEGQVRTAIQLDDRQTIAEQLGGLLENTPAKADLLRHKAGQNLAAREYDMALGNYQKALTIDERFENLIGVSADYQGRADAFLALGKHVMAEDDARRAEEAARDADCWKAVRGSLITQARIAEDRGDTAAMIRHLVAAEELSERAGDEDASKSLRWLRKHASFVATGEALGIYKENGDVDKAGASFALDIWEMFGKADFAHRMGARMDRIELLKGMRGEAGAPSGLTAGEAGKLFRQLGFKAVETDVDLDAFRAWKTKVSEAVKGAGGLDNFTEMMTVRGKAMKQIEIAKSREDFFFARAWFQRMGFDLDDPTVCDSKLFHAEMDNFRLASDSMTASPMVFAVHCWAKAFATLKEGTATDVEKAGARAMLKLLGVRGDPREITHEAAEELLRVTDRLRQQPSPPDA